MKAKINNERAAKLVAYFYGRITSQVRKPATLPAGDVAQMWRRLMTIAHISGALNDNYNPAQNVGKAYNKAYALGYNAPTPFCRLMKELNRAFVAA